VEGKVCINDEINHVVSCIYVETIAEPINTIISRQHSVKHKVLEFQECNLFSVERGEGVCFVHAIIMTQIGGDYKRSCATS